MIFLKSRPSKFMRPRSVSWPSTPFRLFRRHRQKSSKNPSQIAPKPLPQTRKINLKSKTIVKIMQDGFPKRPRTAPGRPRTAPGRPRTAPGRLPDGPGQPRAAPRSAQTAPERPTDHPRMARRRLQKNPCMAPASPGDPGAMRTTRSFVRSFVRSLVSSFVRACVPTFAPLCVRSLRECVRARAHAFVPLCVSQYQDHHPRPITIS